MATVTIHTATEVIPDMDTGIEADMNPGMITGTATGMEEVTVSRMAMDMAITMATIVTVAMMVAVIVTAAGITKSLSDLTDKLPVSKTPQAHHAAYSSSFSK